MSIPTPLPRTRRDAVTGYVRRTSIFVAGATVTAAGVAMVVLPGPGVLVVFLGLMILATEFAWAARALDPVRLRARDATAQLRASRRARLTSTATATALITIGVGTLAILDQHRMLGVAALTAGLGTLVVLTPAVERLLARELRPRGTDRP